MYRTRKVAFILIVPRKNSAHAICNTVTMIYKKSQHLILRCKTMIFEIVTMILIVVLYVIWFIIGYRLYSFESHVDEQFRILIAQINKLNKIEFHTDKNQNRRLDSLEEIHKPKK